MTDSTGRTGTGIGTGAASIITRRAMVVIGPIAAITSATIPVAPASMPSTAPAISTAMAEAAVVVVAGGIEV
ncbi:hypothetical protein NY820_09275, partial [Escherichia coli]|uniref:hypothetical protein n=1 Tax=Escherichia coli TaxID=562 RepID=UPI0022EFFFFB